MLMDLFFFVFVGWTFLGRGSTIIRVFKVWIVDFSGYFFIL